jgi:hypothetical protein
MKANVSTDKDSKGVDLIAEDYVWVFIEDENRCIELFIELEKNGNDIQVVLSDPLANNYVHEEWEALDYLRANLDEDFISKEELGDVLTTKEN